MSLKIFLKVAEDNGVDTEVTSGEEGVMSDCDISK